MADCTIIQPASKKVSTQAMNSGNTSTNSVVAVPSSPMVARAARHRTSRILLMVVAMSLKA